ncbi:MAG TPA: hypothetical protein VGQ76_19825 [Thermoanaerobaculia bacterium]|jgi:hypothetical protein|nr:hypothetical protein [Thermoanaerobaculia bacterium]
MTCEDYFEDPVKHASHLDSCTLCSALEEDSHLAIEPRPLSTSLSVDALPMATWEGASHRTWPLVAIGTVAVFVLAMALFLAAGTPPLRGIAHAVTSGFTSFEAASKFLQLFGTGLHNAPTLVHVTIAVLFVFINTLLFVLLRRAPRGIDV